VSVDDEIGALYELPLDEFTAARNALAKRLAKEDAETAAGVKKLTKPTVPAWAVNQLAHREPKLLEELVQSGEALQKQTLKGSVEALRDSQRRERELARKLVGRAEALLKEAGHSPSAQTLERVSATLTAGAQTEEGREALRSGRLSAELEPVGFEALVGMTPAKRTGARDELAEARRAKEERKRQRRRLEEELRKLERRAQSAEREAERAERDAAEAREAADKARAAADEAAQELAELG
jgi:predicted ribosome quality control (RQC) complex YloA/Tae2 family protein